MSSNSPCKSVFIWKTRNLNSAAKFAQNNVTNPPNGLCKADTEGGSIGGEAALITKTCQYLSFGGGF